MKKSIEDFAHRKNISLTTFSAKLKARNLKTVCKTFHKAGLAVPYNRKTDVGYRQLGESDGKKELRKNPTKKSRCLFKSIFKLRKRKIKM